MQAHVPGEPELLTKEALTLSGVGGCSGTDIVQLARVQVPALAAAPDGAFSFVHPDHADQTMSLNMMDTKCK